LAGSNPAILRGYLPVIAMESGQWQESQGSGGVRRASRKEHFFFSPAMPGEEMSAYKTYLPTEHPAIPAIERER
jgi:hypothetical protein